MRKSLAIAAVLSVLAAPAFSDDAHHPAGAGAQPAPTGQGSGMMGGGGMMGMMSMHGMMSCSPLMGIMSGKHIDGHLAFLRTELKITSGQEKAWSAFAGSVRDIAKDMGDHEMGGGMMQGKKMSAPDGMNMHIAMMEHHLKALKAMQAATAKLYGALSAEQKAMADELLGHKGMM